MISIIACDIQWTHSSFPFRLLMINYLNLIFRLVLLLLKNIMISTELGIYPYVVFQQSLHGLDQISSFSADIHTHKFLWFNALHQLPLVRDLNRLPHIVRSFCSTYHPIMDLLWRINASSFNACVIISAGCLADSILIMDVLELETYAQKWSYFPLMCFSLASWPHMVPISVPADIFKHPTYDSWWNYANVISKGIHFFKDRYDSNGLAQCLAEWNLVNLSRSYGYLCLGLLFSHTWTYHIWYNKYWSRMCHIWIILIFLWKPITAKIIIRQYLGIAVVMSDVYSHFVSSLQVYPYPLGIFTM